MERAVWGLPQARKLLQKLLVPHVYYECINTPGLWKHKWRPISFTLVIDDFGIKYVVKEHADHFVECIQTKYKLIEDWSSNLYCGVKLKWDYGLRMLGQDMYRSSS
jgi:hypothetical protein